MREEWQGRGGGVAGGGVAGDWQGPEGIGRLWSYGLKFEDWAAQVCTVLIYQSRGMYITLKVEDWAAQRESMAAVGKECASTLLEPAEDPAPGGSNADGSTGEGSAVNRPTGAVNRPTGVNRPTADPEDTDVAEQASAGGSEAADAEAKASVAYIKSSPEVHD